MSMYESLVRDYRAVTGLRFQNYGEDYPVIVVENRHASAKIALHGAHVLSFIPTVSGDDLLWMSDKAIFREGKAIRGGIPICWPWFGPYEGSPEKQAHGFARNRFWKVQSINQLEQEETSVVFEIREDTASKALWNFPFTLQLQVIIGKELSLKLIMLNTGQETYKCTAALHSYLAVSDISRVSVLGLEGKHFVDKVHAGKQDVQQKVLTIDREIDRVYMDADPMLKVKDSGSSRTLVIKKSGSASSVVWNPWLEKSSAMADFEENAYKRMLCVETANVGPEDDVILEPGETHCLQTVLGLETV